MRSSLEYRWPITDLEKKKKKKKEKKRRSSGAARFLGGKTEKWAEAGRGWRGGGGQAAHGVPRGRRLWPDNGVPRRMGNVTRGRGPSAGRARFAFFLFGPATTAQHARAAWGWIILVASLVVPSTWPHTSADGNRLNLRPTTSTSDSSAACHAFTLSPLLLSSPLLCLSKPPLSAKGGFELSPGRFRHCSTLDNGVIRTRAHWKPAAFFFHRRPAAERSSFLAGHYRGAIPIVRLPSVPSSFFFFFFLLLPPPSSLLSAATEVTFNCRRKGHMRYGLCGTFEFNWILREAMVAKGW